MRRNHRDKELDQLQRVKKENDRLKRQIASLRKQITRIDIDRYENLKELMERQDQEDRAVEIEEIQERLKQEWKCKSCKEGYLEIIKYSKLDEQWYYRKCNCCDNRTRGKRFTNEVRGIVKA